MKRFILVTLFFIFFGIFSNVFAYDFPDLPHSLPYEYNGVAYDYVVQAAYGDNSNPYMAFSATYCQSADSARPTFRQRNYGGYIEINIAPGAHCVNLGTIDSNYTWSSYHYVINNNQEPVVIAENYANQTELVGLFRSTVDLNYSSWSEPNQGFDFGVNFGLYSVAYNETLIAASDFRSSSFELKVVNSPEIGGGVHISAPGYGIYDCGINDADDCNFDFGNNAEVTLEAYPNEGYDFLYWKINKVINSDTDGAITITMEEGVTKEVQAVFYSESYSFPDLPHSLPYEYNGVTYDYVVQAAYGDNSDPHMAFSATYCQSADSARPTFRQRNYGGYIEINIAPGAHCVNLWTTDSNYTWSTYHYVINNNQEPVVIAQNYATQTELLGLFRSTVDLNYSSWSELNQGFDFGVNFGLYSVAYNETLIAASSFGGEELKQVSVTRSPELGGGVTITPPLGFPYYHCGVNGGTTCELDIAYNAQVTLEAQPNAGYAFSHWEINSATMGDTDGTIVIPMSEDKDVVAVFYLDMKLPLSGGKNWLLSVEAGGQRQCNLGVDSYHTDTGYYALDFTDNTLEDGHLEGTDVPIRAALGGFVDFAGGDPNDNGYGYNVVIDHGNGYKTRYAHLKYEPTVSGTVIQGQSIGIMGNTGNSTGIHLHFQIYHDDDSSLNNEGIGFVRLENSTLGSYQVGCNEFYLSTNN